jgi:cysteine desulfurase
VEESRERLAVALGCGPTDVIFTSGGTESDNLAVAGLYRARRAADARRTWILVGATEHHAVLGTAHWLARHEGAQVCEVAVGPTGELDTSDLAAQLRCRSGEVALCAVMWANNEVGAINPIDEVGRLCAEHAVPLVVDAVQAFGQVPVTLGPATALAISAHKFGGPPGVGALAIARTAVLEPLLHGGGQERGLRSGSLNVPGIAGMAAAADAALSNSQTQALRLSELRSALVAGVRRTAPEAICNGPAQVRGGAGQGSRALPGLAHLTFPGHRAAAMLMVFDAAGVCISTGAACSAGVLQPSHVLAAMGQPESLSGSNLRVSLGHDSTPADVAAFLEVLPAALARSGAQARRGSAVSG